jgi:iron complex transport system permease protein
MNAAASAGKRTGVPGPFAIAVLIAMFILLCGASLLLGVGDVTLSALWHASFDDEVWELFAISRVPRTIALILAGVSMAIAGMIMQMLMRNRFVEPSTAGTMESATLGILLVTLLTPDLPVIIKMLVATLFAMAGTGLFIVILRRLPLRSTMLVPVIGLVLGGVIHAITVFFAYQYDLLQSLHAWTTGDFSGVLRGRYELLWVAFALACAAYIAADRFTVVGMGEQFTTNLGLNHRRLTIIGLIIVSAVSAVVVTTVGSIPFLGLLVPNVVSMYFGDNMRKSVPWVAVLGALFVLACDIVGRLVYFPYEIPIGTVVGIVGSVLFLCLLLNRRTRFG